MPQNAEELISRLPRAAEDMSVLTRFGIAIHREEGAYSVLTDLDIAALVGCFPLSALARSNIRSIRVMGSRWFHRESTPSNPKVTTDPTQALSPTAIVPSFISHDEENNTSHIVLYAMDKGVVPLYIQRIIHSQSLAHELAHGFVTRELYGTDDLTLALYNGARVDAFDYLCRIAEIITSSGPISHYASAYLVPGTNNLPEDPVQHLLGISENTVESIAALLLGFAFQPDGEDSLFPFSGTKEALHDHVCDYLEAIAIAS